jgi:hypothetical protein
MKKPRKKIRRSSRVVVKRRARPRLETVAQAEARNAARIKALSNHAPEIAAEIEACKHDALVPLIICAVCSRRFRFPLIRELLRIARSEPGDHQWVTIYLETIPECALPEVNVKRVRDRLRKSLQRSGFAGSILIGGIEVSWLTRDRVWVLHVHLLAIRVPPGAWESLEQKLAETGRSDPLDVDDLNNPERQISYTIKYVTYHRPGKIGPDGHARAYPLPPDRLAELAHWWAHYTHSDFIFLYGARRRGGHIVPER